MIHRSFMILFALISIAGAIVYFCSELQINRKMALSLCFFICCHTFFLIVGITLFFTSLPIWLLVLSIVLVFIARICNGSVIYGKNNPTHYLVNGSMMAVVFVLYLYDM